MSIKDKLEIFIITYNRRPYLEKTLETILANNSPIKDFDIKILDNNSTDDTGELCQKFTEKHKNLTYIKNHRNVGLSGNICKAMEYASKEYFWVLCDNDDLDFSAWNEVEQGIEDKKDLILVCDDYFEPNYQGSFEALVLNQLTFLPSGIYRTEHLTDNVMSYAIADTYTVLPHLALGCAIINKKGSIKAISKAITSWTDNIVYSKEMHKTLSFDRTIECSSIVKNKRVLTVNFYAGIARCFDACKDKDVRYKAILNFIKIMNGKGPVLNMPLICDSFIEGKTPVAIFIDFVACLPLKLRLKIIFIMIFTNLIWIDKTPKKVKLRIFHILSITLYRFQKK